MTTFLDFVLTNGTPRLTVVRKAKSEYGREYHRARDFYKPLRDAIIDMHRNQKSKESLDLILNLNDQRKIGPYRERIVSYQRWCGRKRFEWIGSQRKLWSYGDLSIRVNPELVMYINGSAFVIKLYFKADTPSKLRLYTTFQLLTQTFTEEIGESTPAIFDVRRGKLFEATQEVPDIEALLIGEAVAFQAMWEQI